MSELTPNPEKVQALTSKINKGQGGDISLIAKEMANEHLLVKYIKKLQLKTAPS